jgi:putative SOS response-associated peptidase YedK
MRLAVVGDHGDVETAPFPSNCVDLRLGAGLWEAWNKGEEPVQSCTILTTEANDLMRPLHDRMPVILHREDYDRWLDTGLQDAGKLMPLLVPYSGDDLTA